MNQVRASSCPIPAHDRASGRHRERASSEPVVRFGARLSARLRRSPVSRARIPRCDSGPALPRRHSPPSRRPPARRVGRGRPIAAERPRMSFAARRPGSADRGGSRAGAASAAGRSTIPGSRAASTVLGVVAEKAVLSRPSSGVASKPPLVERAAGLAASATPGAAGARRPRPTAARDVSRAAGVSRARSPRPPRGRAARASSTPRARTRARRKPRGWRARGRRDRGLRRGAARARRATLARERRRARRGRRRGILDARFFRGIILGILDASDEPGVVPRLLPRGIILEEGDDDPRRGRRGVRERRDARERSRRRRRPRGGAEEEGEGRSIARETALVVETGETGETVRARPRA